MNNVQTIIAIDQDGIHVALIGERADACVQLSFFMLGSTLRAKVQPCEASRVDEEPVVIPCNSIEEAMRFIPSLLNTYGFGLNESDARKLIEGGWKYENDLREYLRKCKGEESCESVNGDL